MRILTKKNRDKTFVLLDTEGLRALEQKNIDTIKQRNNDNRLATFVLGIADICLVNIEKFDHSHLSSILQMVCKSFLKFKSQDKDSIFDPARCIFIHQKIESMTNDDIGPQREKLLSDLNKCANIASEMINRGNRYYRLTAMTFISVKMANFNQVIQIEDNFNVNTFLERLSQEEKKHRVKDLNSIFVKHMFSRTENPSDSEISSEYIERIHETGSILLNFSDIKRQRESNNLQSGGFKRFSVKMKNLIDLINAEKFDFEDLDAWRMGSKIETMFQERWKKLSDEFSKLKASINDRIRQNEKVSGKISTIGEIQEIVDVSQNDMIKMQENSIRAIRDLELAVYFKERLIEQLSDQIRNESRDLKIILIDLFHQHEHEMRRTKGKFSNSSLKKKIVELIENEQAVENISERELLQKFNHFWNGIIKNKDIVEFRESMKTTQKEQSIKYRRDLKKGFEACFENDQFDIAAKQKFENMKSIEDWEFTENQFKNKEIFEEQGYFEKDRLKQFRQWLTNSSKSKKQFMPQLFNQLRMG